MTFPIEFGFGHFRISAHLVFETLAFVIGFRYFLFLRNSNTDKISDPNRVWIIIGAIFGAFFFSRILGILENPQGFADSEHKFLYFFSHKTIVGGVLGGLLFVEITKKVLHVRSSSGDLFTYPLILAMIIGRIGCFFNGVYEDTYGEPTNFILGMDLGDGLYRHPVTLYEIAFLIILWIGLKIAETRMQFRDGVRFQLFMIFYLLFRLALDFIKPGTTFLWNIGAIQLFCLAGLVYYHRTILHLILNPSSLYDRRDPELHLL
jgi:prolipoprotein diacylglyceryltransferase